MAALTTVALIGAGVAVAGGAVKSISGAKQANDAKQEMENYERQTLENKYENLRVSRLGADLQTQQLARQEASTTEALRSGGSRGLAMMSGLNQQQNLAQRQIGADLDMQQVNLDKMKAQGGMQVQNMQEARENQDLAGLSSQYNQGKQMMWDGMGDMAQGLNSGMMGSFNASQAVGDSGAVAGSQFTKMLNNTPSKTNFASSF